MLLIVTLLVLAISWYSVEIEVILFVVLVVILSVMVVLSDLIV